MCSGRRLLRCLTEGGSFLRGGEARLGWGFAQRRRSFFGEGDNREGGLTPTRGREQARGSRLVMIH